MVLFFLMGAVFPLEGQTPIQNFTLTNVADGSVVSLETYASSQGLAIIFTSNACPYDAYYADRIKSLVQTYQGKIQFMLINSHQEPEESQDKMKEAYAKWNLDAPYLVDKDQVAMNALGARKSPEVFLLVNEKGNYTVIYSGAIDDNPQMVSAVTSPYLKTAVDKRLAGDKDLLPGTRSVGCSIRKK